MDGNVERNRRKPIPQEVDNLAYLTVDAAYKVHSTLGPGLLENVYETCLLHEITKNNISAKRQVGLPVQYDGLTFETGYRLDLLVENCLIVELKAVEAVLPVHKAQVLTYLRLTGYRLGLLINFNVPLIKNGIWRIAN